MPAKRTTTPPAAAPARPPYMLIEQIQVKGYKSLIDATLHVRPLTLLAGTNSSGKSSIMQPLLLLKQTMEASYNPAGALVLSGAHVQAETARELVSKIDNTLENCFSVRFEGNNVYPNNIMGFAGNPYSFLELNYQVNKENFRLVSQKSMYNSVNKFNLSVPDSWKLLDTGLTNDDLYGKARYENGFLVLDLMNKSDKYQGQINHSLTLEPVFNLLYHIPGLRNNPKRSYLSTFFQDQIRGTFDLYAAGTIAQWQQQNNVKALAQLNDSLQRLGLTNSVTAKVKNANEVELSVNRLPAASKTKPRKADMVNIADVGIGVSQVLPILVALIAAQEGQIVYVEQPELHLHPKAQVAMGELLAEAANRGVRVIVETHSSLLLLTVQTLIAQGKIANTDVGLHWFTRNAKGATDVQYVVPDEDGAYGEWPEDFSEIELKAQDAYLTAVGLRQFGEAAQ